MKRFMVVVALMTAIGSMAFSKDMSRRGEYHHNRGGYCHENNYRNGGYRDSESRILMDEKRIEIRKELLKDNPDWTKIEKLKVEMATESAKSSTERMKERHESRSQKEMKQVIAPANN